MVHARSVEVDEELVQLLESLTTLPISHKRWCHYDQYQYYYQVLLLLWLSILTTYIIIVIIIIIIMIIIIIIARGRGGRGAGAVHGRRPQAEEAAAQGSDNALLYSTLLY